jgi:LemA protein
MSKTLWIVLAIVVLIGGYFWMSYNGFVSQNAAVDGQWAQVQTVYQRRFDLIPNLVASVQGIMKQEKEVFGALAEARTRYAGAGTVDEKAAAATQVEGALSRLLVVMENYPQLQSSQAVQNLMTQLEGSENRIAVERQRYNDAVQTLDTRIHRFPSNIVASVFGFKDRTYFQVAQGAENAPKVQL